jgi:hypothetical protein
MTFRASCAARSVAVALLLAAPFAHADDDARARDAALKDFNAGLAQLKKGDAEGARLSFLRSFAEWGTISALSNLAYAESLTGRCVDALGHLRTVVRAPDADPAFVQSKAPQVLQQCSMQVGHLHIVAAAGAMVTIDTHRARDLSEIIDVLPGSHVVVSKRGDVEESLSVFVSAGESRDVVVSTPPLASPLRVAEPPAADIPPPAQSGEFWTARRVWGMTLVGAAAASLAASGGFAAQGNSDADKASSLRGSITSAGATCYGNAANAQCSSLASTRDAEDRDRTFSEVFLGIGLAAAAVGATLTLWPDATHSHGVSFAPTVEPRLVGLHAEGAF